MSRIVLIRNVPDALHRKHKVRAARVTLKTSAAAVIRGERESV